MHSSRSIHPLAMTNSSTAKKEKKKTVKFSSGAKLSNCTSGNDLQAHATWLTAKEIFSMKKRAKTLSILHFIKTRTRQPNAPSNLSGIVYNCHPAHYEIIGESLRGMEHYTDISQARRREWLRSNAISLVEEHQNLHKTSRSKLACMYRESAEEAMVHSRKVAEEDANIAAIIMAEDLKQDFDGAASSPSSSTPLSSTRRLP